MPELHLSGVGLTRKPISAVLPLRDARLSLTHYLYIPLVHRLHRVTEEFALHTFAKLPENGNFIKTYAEPEPLRYSSQDKVSYLILVLGDFSKPFCYVH